MRVTLRGGPPSPEAYGKGTPNVFLRRPRHVVLLPAFRLQQCSGTIAHGFCNLSSVANDRPKTDLRSSTAPAERFQCGLSFGVSSYAGFHGNLSVAGTSHLPKT